MNHFQITIELKDSHGVMRFEVNDIVRSRPFADIARYDVEVRAKVRMLLDRYGDHYEVDFCNG